jgi:hypothetical protein
VLGLVEFLAVPDAEQVAQAVRAGPEVRVVIHGRPGQTS